MLRDVFLAPALAISILSLTGCGAAGSPPATPPTTGNASLATLTISSGELDPGFSPDTLMYTMAVGFLVEDVALTPTPDASDSTVTVNGNPTTSGTSSTPIPLGVGPTPILVEVTAVAGTTTRAYTVVVTRSAQLSQEAYIKASNPGPFKLFGTSMALSGDTLVLGAPFEQSGALGVDDDDVRVPGLLGGAAYVFVRRDAVWTQQAHLKVPIPGSRNSFPGTGAFGNSVAIDGDTIVVGAPEEYGGGNGVDDFRDLAYKSQAGAAYVFTRTGSSWTQEAYLKASNPEHGDQFGSSVGVSREKIVVGAKLEDSTATGIDGDQIDNGGVAVGAAYVFARSAATWTQQAYLKASNADTLDLFGETAAIWGNTIVVGARGEASGTQGTKDDPPDESAAGSGAVYVFVRESLTWTQQAYLKAPRITLGLQFGHAVAISGSTVVVGAVGDGSGATLVNGDESDTSSLASGAAHVFTRSGTIWSRQAYLKASFNGLNDKFGFSVAIAGDRIVVGAPLDDSRATGVDGDGSDDLLGISGAAHVFVRGGTTWSHQSYLKAAVTDTLDAFGFSVAISEENIAVSAWGESSGSSGVNGDALDNGAERSGAGYIFR